jgi:hypothetical protein
MKRLLIVACSATKNGAAEPIPALERYDGVAYRVIRRWQRDHFAQADQLAILILSARYGLIAPDTCIPTYNDRRTVSQASALRSQTRPAFETHLAARGPYQVTCICMGQHYWKALELELFRPYLGIVTRTEGGIGMQLQQLKRWLWEVQP